MSGCGGHRNHLKENLTGMFCRYVFFDDQKSKVAAIAGQYLITGPYGKWIHIFSQKLEIWLKTCQMSSVCYGSHLWFLIETKNDYQWVQSNLEFLRKKKNIFPFGSMLKLGELDLIIFSTLSVLFVSFTNSAVLLGQLCFLILISETTREMELLYGRYAPFMALSKVYFLSIGNPIWPPPIHQVLAYLVRACYHHRKVHNQPKL
jgi:hypothetical protein